MKEIIDTVKTVTIIINDIVIILFVFSETPSLRIAFDKCKTPETAKNNTETFSMIKTTIDKPNSKAEETNNIKSDNKRKTVNMFLNQTFDLEGVKQPPVIAFFNAFFRQ